MASKQMNRLIIAGVIVAIGLVVLVTCSDDKPGYTSLDALPEYDDEKKGDGDTTTDTIKALQAFAKAAVDKADDLHETTESRLENILENKNDVARLEIANNQSNKALEKTHDTLKALQDQLVRVNRELNTLQQDKLREERALDTHDLPVGFGFDEKGNVQQQGQWYNPADVIIDENAKGGSQYTALLRPPKSAATPVKHVTPVLPEPVIIPVYTLPKDTLLTDAISFNALVGRIPVGGQTPDPYPVRIFVGKENLAANGHDIPEVEGMIFSGFGIGDWNLSCVSARLFSATYIFTDGTIVNHSTDEPLATISDPQGVPCVAGRFVSNAPTFLAQRIGLAGIGAAGAAYAEAQTQRDTSALTGTTSSTVVGDLDKLATGKAVQSASDEVTQWLLERQQQSFDAVVVNPGAQVSVHIETTLAIDYDPHARKIRYDTKDTTTISALD